MLHEGKRPDRLAHIHPMRTAGTYLAAYLHDVLPPQCSRCHSWQAGLDRDWTTAELLAFVQRRGPLYVHNHVVNWTRDLVHRYHRAGFFLFAFVRDVGDQLCSLHHWLLIHQRQRHDPSLDAFIRRQLAGGTDFGIDYNDWAAPDYWELLDFVNLFSAESFRTFRRLLELPEPSGRLRPSANASPNRGWLHYCRTGEVTAETQQQVAASEFQQRVDAIRRRGMPQVINLPHSLNGRNT